GGLGSGVVVDYVLDDLELTQGWSGDEHVGRAGDRTGQGIGGGNRLTAQRVKGRREGMRAGVRGGECVAGRNGGKWIARAEVDCACVPSDGVVSGVLCRRL